MWLDDSFKYDKNNEVLSNITILNNTHNAELQRTDPGTKVGGMQYQEPYHSKNDQNWFLLFPSF